MKYLVLFILIFVTACSDNITNNITNEYYDDAGVSLPDASDTVSPEVSESEFIPPEVPVVSASALISYAEMQPGAEALVVTVIEGTTPTALMARYVKIVHNPLTNDPSQPFYVFETDVADPRWAEWGGPAGGMSGSPVMIDGRLAGALSYSVGGRLEPPFMFIATPISYMLGLEDGAPVDGSQGASLMEMCLDVRPVDALLVGFSTALSGEAELPMYLRQPTSIARPMNLGGVSVADIGADVPLEAGSSIGVHLVWGDMVSIFSIGTVTVIDGDNLYAFGHPFLWNGEADMPFSTAPILGINTDPFGGSKVGTASQTFQGRITQDRLAGISGELGDTDVDAIAVSAEVTLPDGELVETTYEVARVDIANLAFTNTPLNIALPILYLIDGQRDQIGTGTIDLTVEVSFREVDTVASWNGFFSGTSDMTSAVAFQVLSVVDIFYENPMFGLTIDSVRVVADVSNDARLIEMVDLVDPPRTVTLSSDGESTTLTLDVEFMQLPLVDGATPDVRQFTIDIPADFPLGAADIMVGRDSDIGQTYQGEPEDRYSLEEWIEWTVSELPAGDNLLEIRLVSNEIIECTPDFCDACEPECREECPVCEGSGSCELPCETVCDAWCDPCPCSELPFPREVTVKYPLEASLSGNLIIRQLTVQAAE